MEIGAQSAGQLYGAAVKAAQPGAAVNTPIGDALAGPSFGETLENAVTDTMATIAQGEQMAKAGVAGQADPHSVVEALAATEMALEMAVTVRDKVVEAYQEILRMPV